VVVTESKALTHAGVVLIVCSLAFVAVFGYLARTFGYPDVLQRGADAVLPALLAGGHELRAVWIIYAALPLGIVFAGASSAPLLARASRILRIVGVAAAVVAGFAMTTGLLRWPTLEWNLARAWATAVPGEQPWLAARFDASNFILGNLVGELAGEIFLAIWFLTVALAFRADGRRTLAGLGVGAAVVLAVAALRNITPAVAHVARISNVVLPIWLLTLGVVFLHDGLRGRLERRPSER
jgi:hypothetical protein